MTPAMMFVAVLRLHVQHWSTENNKHETNAKKISMKTHIQHVLVWFCWVFTFISFFYTHFFPNSNAKQHFFFLHRSLTMGSSYICRLCLVGMVCLCSCVRFYMSPGVSFHQQGNRMGLINTHPNTYLTHTFVIIHGHKMCARAQAMKCA